jgi:ABC-type phosphate/phosphonate transport system permease subunit
MRNEMQMKQQIQEKNIWKTATIILAIVCLLLIVAIQLRQTKIEKNLVNIQGIEIDRDVFESLLKMVNNTDTFALGDIQNKRMVMLRLVQNDTPN